MNTSKEITTGKDRFASKSVSCFKHTLCFKSSCVGIDCRKDTKPPLPSLALPQPRFICCQRHILNQFQMTQSQANVLFPSCVGRLLPSGEVTYDPFNSLITS